MKRAIISVSDKTGVVELAKFLSEKGVEIISTGGTAKTIEQAGISITKISDYTGFPEMLDGRVKTLNPKVFAGLLARRDVDDHMTQLKEHEIPQIDMVVVNLYPFEQTISKDCTFEEAIENIDIGGPSLLRASAKNFKDVVVVCNPDRYEEVMKKMQDNSLDADYRKELAREVYSHTARYDTLISTYIDENELPETYFFSGKKVQELRYGENPYQVSAFYKDLNIVEPCIGAAKQLQGKELSYNNIMDADGALEIVKEFAEPCVSVIKHANPCGAAVTEGEIDDALVRAYNADPLSAYGGIIALNRKFNKACAEFLKDKFVEVIIAPEYDADALDIMKEKPNVRLLLVQGLESFKKSDKFEKFTTKKVVGGMLVQSRNFPIMNPSDIKVVKNENPTKEDVDRLIEQAKSGVIRELMCVTKREPTEQEVKDMIFAVKVAKYVKSNSILYAKDGVTVGIGAGQMSRVDATIIATRKSDGKAKDAVMVSDAFFPFRDGVDEAVKSGISAIIQPGGSIRDKEVIQAANEHGISMIFSGTRIFLH